MHDALRPVIVMVSLLLSQTIWAQETRETPCAPVDVTSFRDRVQLQCADEVRDGGGCGVCRPFFQYGERGADRRKSAGCAIPGKVLVVWRALVQLRKGMPPG